MKNSRPTDRVASPSNDSDTRTGELLPRNDAPDHSEERVRRTTRHSRTSAIYIYVETTTVEEVSTGIGTRNV